MRLGPWDIEYEQEVIQERGMGADERWRFIDAAGHGHFCQDGKWPTLRLVTENLWCEEHGEDEATTHHVCPHCGEIIRPGMIDLSLLGRPRLGPISMTIRHSAQGVTRTFHLGDEDARAVLSNPVDELLRRSANVVPDLIEYTGP